MIVESALQCILHPNVLRPYVFAPKYCRPGHYTCKGLVYAKMFYGEMVLFSGGMPSWGTFEGIHALV